MRPSGKMRGAGWWPSNAVRRTVTVTGVDPVAAGTVGATDRVWARGMAGRTGKIRAGMSSSQSYGFKGYLNYDVLALLRTVGVSTNLRYSPNISLPGTTSGKVTMAGPGEAGHSVLDSLAAIPAGFR